jgi:hypothetical protein
MGEVVKLERARIIPAFRPVAAGETRVSGTLTAIDCHDNGVSLVVDLDGRQLRATAKAFDHIEFITYRDDVKGAVACGVRQAPEAVYVTWTGADGGTHEVTASQIVIEFLPPQRASEVLADATLLSRTTDHIVAIASNSAGIMR